MLLSDVAEKLFTSVRHARTLLKEMHLAGWIEWTPKVGRNQRSGLTVLRTVVSVTEDVALDWIKQGHYDKALELLEQDQLTFGRLLQSTSGAVYREGQLHIQLTYSRTLTTLLPHLPLRNSERFLVRQLYSCLVSSGKDGQLSAELAHHWIYDASRICWTFYLRPNLQFHNGEPITAQCIVELFELLKALPAYQQEMLNIREILAPQPLLIEIYLTRPFPGLPNMLADLKYSIQPVTQVVKLPRSERDVVGSGAFYLAEHDNTKLQLKANNHYFAIRPLTDEVTIWLLTSIADKEDDFNSKGCSHQVDIVSTQNIKEVKTAEIQHSALTPNLDTSNPASGESWRTRIEEGCLFILFNESSINGPLSYQQRKWLATQLSAKNLWRVIEQRNMQFSSTLAENMFPFWQPVLPMPVAEDSETTLPTTLAICLYDHPALERCAQAITEILASFDIVTEITVLPHAELERLARNKQLTHDLILNNINLDDNRETSALISFLSNSVLHHSLGAENSHWLMKLLTIMMTEKEASQYLVQLEPLITTLIHQGWISPMFHHRQSLSFQGVIKGVEITTWGWPQLRDVWSAD